MSTDQTRSNPQFPLRLPKSLKETAKELAFKEGISLNHFISVAVAEKVSRIEHQAASSSVNHVGDRREEPSRNKRPGGSV